MSDTVASPLRERNGGNPTSRQSVRVLIVDDENIIRTLLTEILAEDGYDTVSVSDGADAIRLLETEPFDVVISDMVMPGKSGVDVLQAAFRIDPNYPVVMITGYPSLDTAVRLVNLGAADYITKPFNAETIKTTVAKVLREKRGQGGTPTSGSADNSVGLDPVTGLYNASLFKQLLETEVARCSRHGSAFSLVAMSIDGFYERVAGSGHAAREQVLRLFARYTSQELGPGDVLGHTSEAELSMILPNASRADAYSLAMRVVKSAGSLFKVNAGVAQFPGDASSASGLLSAARSSSDASR